MTAKNNLELNGILRRCPSVELLAEISQMKLDGSLRLSEGDCKIIVYFDKGDVVFAVSNSRKHRLFEILLSQNQLTKQQLNQIENFTNDFYLAKTLIKTKTFNKETIDVFFNYQIKEILSQVISLKMGEWTFSSLARIKDGIRYEIELEEELIQFAKNQADEYILERFKSFDEIFSLNENKNLENINFSPNEAFIISRLAQSATSIKDLRIMCGFSKTETLQILYSFWLGGLIHRDNWNSVFSSETISNINSAKISLKTSAVSVEEEQERAEQKRIKEEELAAKKEQEKALEEKQKAEREKEATLTLEEYIKRIEEAATHYEIFNIPTNAHIKDIKTVYFKYAKQFHPDLFQKQVDEDYHRKIQICFTEIAQAYETLKDKEAREVYDFKLRKAIDNLKGGTEQTITKEDLDGSNKETLSIESFEEGYQYLMNDDYAKALPHLGRAVKLADKNARYQAFYGKALSYDKTMHHSAVNHLESAVRLDSKNVTYRLMLSELLIEVGLVARAKGELNRLLKIAPNNKEAVSLLDRLSDK